MSVSGGADTRRLSFPPLRVEPPWEQPSLGHVIDRDYVDSARVTLEAGRTEYRLGYFREGAARLQDLVVRLTHRLGSANGFEGEARHAARVAACAATLVGRTRRILRDDERANDAFAQAVWLFEASGEESFASDELTDFGIALEAVGRGTQAVTRLEAAIHQGSDSVDTLRYLGQSLYERGEAARAEEILRQAVAKGPNEPTPHQILATVLREQGVTDGAIEHFRRAAFAFISHQRLREALEAFDDAIALGDREARTRAARGEVLRRLDEPTEALEALDLALELDPTLAWARASRAAILYTRGEFQAALSSVQQALQHSPDYALAHELHGRLLRIEGDEVGAIDAFRRAIELEPTLLGAYVELGVALFATGRPDSAAEVLRQGLARAPDIPWFMAAIGEAFRAGGYIDDAVELLREAVRRAPESGPAEVALADALSGRAELPEALEAVDRAVAAGMRTPASLRRMSRIYADLGRLREAEALLRRALELKPNSRSSALQLAFVLERLQRDDEAIEIIDNVLGENRHALGPQDSRLLHSKGRLLRARGRLAEAVDPLREALLLDPAAADARIDLSTALWRLGRDTEAQEVIAVLLENEPVPARALALHAAVTITLGGASVALDDLTRACEIDPNDGFAAAIRARAMLETGQTAQAKEQLKRAVALQPQDVEELGEIGDVLRRYGAADEALDHLERARRLAPNSPWILGTIGQVHISQGRVDESIEILRRANGLEPSIAWISASLGEALRASGDARGALIALDAAIERRPRDAWAVASKGAALRDLALLPEAIATLEHALRLSPRDWFALLTLGRSLTDAGSFEEAVPPLDGAIQSSDHLWAWALKGWALQNLGATRAKEALAAYGRAIELGNDPVWCRQGVADTLMTLGKTEESLGEYRTVIEAAGDGATLSADELASVGWCYYATGDTETAVSIYNEVLYRDPSAVPIEFDLFLALVRAGRGAQAMRQFERAHTHAELLEPLRRRGVLEVVAIDMEAAARLGRVVSPCEPTFAQARETIERELVTTREQATARLDQIRAELVDADVDVAPSSHLAQPGRVVRGAGGSGSR